VNPRSDGGASEKEKLTRMDLLGTQRAQSIMLLIVTTILIGTVLDVAQAVLAPALFALVVGIVVSPLADRLDRAGVPRIVVASSLLIAATALLFLALIALEPLVMAMANELPRIRVEIGRVIESAAGFIRGIETLSDELEESVGMQDSDEDSAPDFPTVMDAILLAPNFGAAFLIFFGTLFFFVLTRSELYRAARPYSDKLFRADRAVSRYFAAVSFVNIGLGMATALVMTLIGLNNALLWGLTAALLNFILYLGPLIVALGLLLAGILQFNGLMSLLPPLAFVVLNLTEAQFVTPTIVGQRLAINPLTVFLAIVFGLWLWGPVGAIVALPVSLWVGVLLKPDEHDAAPAKRSGAGFRT